MSHIAKNYYPPPSGAPAQRGAVLALGVALVVATGVAAAAFVPASDPGPQISPHQTAQVEQELSR